MADRPAGLESPRNDFDYTGDAAASRCPFHAHIRKTNPRGSGGFEPEPAERLHIMARRGIPYEDVPRPLHPDGLLKAESLAEFLAKVAPDLPAGGLGLLFMAYNAKIDDQFAFTQSDLGQQPRLSERAATAARSRRRHRPGRRQSRRTGISQGVG